MVLLSREHLTKVLTLQMWPIFQHIAGFVCQVVIKMEGDKYDVQLPMHYPFLTPNSVACTSFLSSFTTVYSLIIQFKVI